MNRLKRIVLFGPALLAGAVGIVLLALAHSIEYILANKRYRVDIWIIPSEEPEERERERERERETQMVVIDSERNRGPS